MFALRKFIAKFLCCFVYSERLKNKIKCRSVFPLGVKRAKHYEQYYSRPINVSFCFNSGCAEIVRVSVASLLINSLQSCHYCFYFVVDKTVTDAHKQALQNVIAIFDKQSQAFFLPANSDFDESFSGQWSKSVYYRLMLIKMLPDLDRIIYCDADTVFLRSLAEADALDMNNNLIAGVLDEPDYINSGFLIFNLRQMRAENTYEKLLYLSQNQEFEYPDQDILNIVCKDRILFLPWKYNVLVFKVFWKMRLYSPHQRKEAANGCVMLHYFVAMKPWNGHRDFPLYEWWWKYKEELDRSFSS